MIHRSSCRKPGVPERLPLDRALELELQVIADYLDLSLLAAVVDLAIAATDTPT